MSFLIFCGVAASIALWLMLRGRIIELENTVEQLQADLVSAREFRALANRVELLETRGNVRRRRPPERRSSRNDRRNA